MAPLLACHGAVRARTILIAVSSVVVLLVLGPYLLNIGSSILRTGCPACPCKYHNDLASLPPVDCGKDDAEMREELDKSVMQLLREELELQATVAEEAQQRAELAFLDAKRTASQFQKEAEKCNAGMEMSEDARAKAESKYADAARDAGVWEKRARDLGWKDDGEDARQAGESEGEDDDTDRGSTNDDEREERTYRRAEREDRDFERQRGGNRQGAGKLRSTGDPRDEHGNEP